MRPIFILLFLFCSPLVRGGEEDAIRIQAELEGRHLPYGTILDPVLQAPESTEAKSYTRCGDSAIWTGHYLASQSYRWAVTRSPEARDQIMAALNGIRKLVDVTGRDVLARCAYPVESPYAADLSSEEAHHTIRTGVVDGQPYFWVGNTSRDQYLGVFFGLTAAWQQVDDQEVHDWVSMLATRLLDRLLDDNFNIVMPGGEISTTFLHRGDQQLALLKLGRQVNPARFETSYRLRANAFAAAATVPVLVDAADSHSSYFKFNLNHLTSYILLTSDEGWWTRRHYERAFGITRDATASHNNAFFDMIATAIDGRDEARDRRVRESLDAWLTRSRFDYWVDLRPEYPACGDDDNRACQIVPVAKRTPTDFLWQRSPYQLYGGLYGTVEGAGIDYLLPYWMARYYGLHN